MCQLYNFTSFTFPESHLVLQMNSERLHLPEPHTPPSLTHPLNVFHFRLDIEGACSNFDRTQTTFSRFSLVSPCKQDTAPNYFINGSFHITCKSLATNPSIRQRKGKGKGQQTACHEGSKWQQRYISILSLSSALEGGGVSATPRPYQPREGDDVPIVQDAGWTPGTVWTGVKKLASNGIRSPDLPARSESLYRLSYRGLRG